MLVRSLSVAAVARESGRKWESERDREAESERTRGTWRQEEEEEEEQEVVQGGGGRKGSALRATSVGACERVKSDVRSFVRSSVCSLVVSAGVARLFTVTTFPETHRLFSILEHPLPNRRRRGK